MSSLLLKWCYLFEASVLDVELLGVNKVKQLAVLLPEGKKGRKLKRFCSVKENVCRAGVEAELSVIHVNVPSTSSPLNAAEGVLVSLLGLDLKVEGAGGGSASGKVDAGDLLEAQVHRRLVHIDEASLQRIEEARGGLVRTCDALSSGVTVEE